MSRRTGLGIVAGATLALIVALPTAAGGWASVTGEELTPSSDDGVSVVRFTLLQHGVTPVDWGAATIVAVNDDSGEQVSVSATPMTDGSGEWTARLALPAAGSWTLTIGHQDLEVVAAQPMQLTVAASAETSAGSPAAAVTIGLVLLAAALILPLSAAAVLARRRASVADRAGADPVTAG
jgi:hypothetical protein